MKSFRDIIVESPVGKVGRTKDCEAIEHIEKSNLAKQFRKIVKELGGKTVARQLLAGMDQTGKKVKIQGTEETEETEEVVENRDLKNLSIEKFLRINGFKIKAENPLGSKKELEFFTKIDAEEALEELIYNKFDTRFNIELKGKKIIYE